MIINNNTDKCNNYDSFNKYISLKHFIFNSYYQYLYGGGIISPIQKENSCSEMYKIQLCIKSDENKNFFSKGFLFCWLQLFK